jgi:hypothetical protein
LTPSSLYQCRPVKLDDVGKPVIIRSGAKPAAALQRCHDGSGSEERYETNHSVHLY